MYSRKRFLLAMLASLAALATHTSHAQTACDSWTPGWTDLAGPLRTDFAPAAVGKQTTYFVFARNADDGSMRYQRFGSTTWQRVPDLPGGGWFGSGPAVAVVNNSLLLVVRGQVGRIFQATYNLTTESWGAWTEIPGDGRTTSTPAVVAQGSITGTSIDYFVRGYDGRIWTNRYDSTLWSPASWSGWEPMPGNHYAADSPSAVLFEGQVHVFSRGFNDRIFENVRATSGWGGWWPVPGEGATPSTPVAAVHQNGRELHLFVRGYNNALFQQTRNLSGWLGGWSEVANGSGIFSAPGVAYANSMLHVFGTSQCAVVRKMSCGTIN